jgi:hypothetical protein
MDGNLDPARMYSITLQQTGRSLAGTRKTVTASFNANVGMRTICMWFLVSLWIISFESQRLGFVQFSPVINPETTTWVCKFRSSCAIAAYPFIRVSLLLQAGARHTLTDCRPGQSDPQRVHDRGQRWPRIQAYDLSYLPPWPFPQILEKNQMTF